METCNTCHYKSLRRTGKAPCNQKHTKEHSCYETHHFKNVSQLRQDCMEKRSIYCTHPEVCGNITERTPACQFHETNPNKRIKMYKTLKNINNIPTSQHNSFQWEINKWYRSDGELELCHNGFHASPTILDAMGYVSPGFIAEVEVRGNQIKDNNKSVHAEMKITKIWEWKKEDSVALAIFSAELVIDIFEKEYPNDSRPRKAIEAARTWLNHPTEENRSAANAAHDAANAAYAAAHTAYVADAARAANAAYAAAHTAYVADAARAANAAYAAAHTAYAAANAYAAHTAYAAANAAANANANAYAYAYAYAADAAAYVYAAANDAANAAGQEILDKIENWIKTRLEV